MIENIFQFKYLIIALSLIFLDKVITLLTIKKVEINFPNRDKFSIEQNPLALYFFKQFGLYSGSFFYAIVSIFFFFFSVQLLSFLFSYNTSFMIISSLYCFALINNIRWFIKYSKTKGQEVEINIAKNESN